MKITKSNFLTALPLIDSCLSECKFLSFDLEMTGINYDLKTEAHKLDSYQFRYKKICEIVKKYEVVEVGLTFYIEKKGENLQLEENSEYYSERTFTFTLFRNSKLKNIADFYTVENPENIFNCFSTYNPDTHRFLHSSNFDYDNLYREGINYSKLSLKEKIKENIKAHLEKGKPANLINVLSKKNEKILIQTISEIVKFLMNKLDNNDNNNNANNQNTQEDNKNKNNNNNNNNKKKNKNQNMQTQKNHKISGLPLSVVNYILSLNLRKIIKLSNFSISRDKQEKNCINIEKSKANIKLDDFLNEFISLENFLEILNIEFIKKQKFSLIVNSITKDRVDDILNDEIGFSHVIQMIIDKKPKIVGHNILYDLLFIYEKFCDFFPDNFVDYCKNINFLFPNIYDTKYLIDRFFKEKDFDHTNLVYIYEKLKDEGYTDYVQFLPEISENFFIGDFKPQKVEEDKKDELDKFHSAGFDSLITGRCFVNIMKALENNYLNRKNLAKALAAKAKQIDSKLHTDNKNNKAQANNNNLKIDNNANQYKKIKKEKNTKIKNINQQKDILTSMNIETNETNNHNKTNETDKDANNTNLPNDDIKPMEIEEELKLNENIILANKHNIEVEKVLEKISDEPPVSKDKILEQTFNKIEKNKIEEEIKIKTGWINFDAEHPHLDTEETNNYMQHIIKTNPMKRDKLANKIILRNYEYPFNIVDFEDIEGLKLKQDFLLKEILRNVFIIAFKDNFVSVFDICGYIQNELFNYTSIKIDDNKALIEIAFDEENVNEQGFMLEKVFDQIKMNERIKEIYNYEEFHKNNFLNLFDK